MQLEFTKVLVRAVVAEREAGAVMGERVTEEVAFYTQEQLATFLPKLMLEIAEENGQIATAELAGVNGNGGDA